MIEKFFSKVDKKLILFSTINVKDITDNRLDASPEKEYLQASISRLKKDFKIRAHKHKSFERTCTFSYKKFNANLISS